MMFFTFILVIKSFNKIKFKGNIYFTDDFNNVKRSFKFEISLGQVNGNVICNSMG